jgi:hypothetical protein
VISRPLSHTSQFGNRYGRGLGIRAGPVTRLAVTTAPSGKSGDEPIIGMIEAETPSPTQTDMSAVWSLRSAQRALDCSTLGLCRGAVSIRPSSSMIDQAL